MSKADFYSGLVADIENSVIRGETAASALLLLTLQDQGIDGGVLRHWVLKKHESEAKLEAWAEIKREELEAGRQAREAARMLYEANAAGLNAFSWWRIDWKAELDRLLRDISPSELRHENTIRAEFMEEGARLDKSRKTQDA